MLEKYPSASPGKLTRLRARCVCNPKLATIGTKKLGLRKTIETASLQLVEAMKEEADTFASISFVEAVNSMWRLDVPKALSDVVEALLGAVLIDSSYDYELTREVVLRLLKKPLDLCTLRWLMIQYMSSSNGLGNLAMGRSNSGWSYS